MCNKIEFLSLNQMSKSLKICVTDTHTLKISASKLFEKMYLDEE